MFPKRLAHSVQNWKFCFQFSELLIGDWMFCSMRNLPFTLSGPKYHIFPWARVLFFSKNMGTKSLRSSKYANDKWHVLNVCVKKNMLIDMISSRENHLIHYKSVYRYMRVVEALPTYGVHYYGVKVSKCL